MFVHESGKKETGFQPDVFWKGYSSIRFMIPVTRTDYATGEIIVAVFISLGRAFKVTSSDWFSRAHL